MYFKSFSAMFSAVRLLLRAGGVLLMLLLAWAGLLTAVYLFASTREATISQLLLTLVARHCRSRAVLRVAGRQRYLRGWTSFKCVECRKITLRLPENRCRQSAVDRYYVAGSLRSQQSSNYMTLATTMRYLLIGGRRSAARDPTLDRNEQAGLRSLTSSLTASVVSKTSCAAVGVCLRVRVSDLRCRSLLAAQKTISSNDRGLSSHCSLCDSQ